MNERLDLFTTPVLKARPPEAGQLNAALISAISEERARSAGVHKSNLGGWHSDTNMTDWGGAAAERLANFAAQTGGAHMCDEHPDGKRKFRWAVDMWANVNRPGDANQVHCHPGSFWSAVYYPDPGGAEHPRGGGELILEDPRYPMAYIGVPDLFLRDAAGEPMRSQMAIRPEAGLLIVFPSWLRHSVRPHRGDRERVSIAINLTPVPE